MIAYIVNFCESIAIALECKELARNGDYEAIKKILEIERVA